MNIIDVIAAGHRVVQNLLSRDYMIGKDGGLHYAEAATAVGALRFAAAIDDKELIGQIVARYELFLEPEQENRIITRKHHVDHNMTGIVPLQIYLAIGDKRYLSLGMTFADNQWGSPRKDGLTDQTRWWIDDMYMVGMLQMQAYRATGDVKYANWAAIQIVTYLRKFQQSNGLFYHGPDFHYFWGRGNGWAAAAMTELLKSLPADQQYRQEIMSCYQKMMTSLLNYQSDNGMWRQLVDYEYSWTESSCSGMFAYAMAAGVNNQWIDGKVYGSATEKAWKALCAYLNQNGEIREICTGTNQKDDIEFYLSRPRVSGDFHGQGPFLWTVIEILQEQSK